MERKNTILLTVIAVATLLVAVVGATFAYFTATTDSTGSGSSVNVTTQTIGTVTLGLTGSYTNTTYLNLPGGYGVSEAIVAVNATENAYDVEYDLVLSYNNQTETDLTWYLYSSTSQVTFNATCSYNETPSGNENTYYYSGCGIDDVISGLTGLTQEATGTFVKETNSTITTSTSPQLQTSSDGGNTYYYLVVLYPNDGDQDADQGDTISFSISNATNVSYNMR